MNALSLQRPVENRYYVRSWALSLAIHGLALAFALTVLSDLRLAPEPEPFKWDVAMVDRPVQQLTEAPSEVAPAKPVPAPSKPAPVQPVTEAVQTIQPVQQVVQQQVREMRQIVQTAAQPTQVVQQTSVQATPVMQTAAQPTPVVNEAVQSQEAMQQEVVVPVEAAAQSVARPVVTEPAQVATSAAAITSPSASRAAPAVADSEAQPIVAASAPVQQTTIRELPVRQAPRTKADYGWLAEALRQSVDELKRYPHIARMNRWEGRVVLRAVVKEDGQLAELAVAESSGYAILDKDAIEVVRQASPLKLKHPLGQPQVVVQVPISYRLR